MGLLDDIAGGLKKGLDYAKEKGELGAKIAQLRLDLVNLSRERDALYARLGKMYFTNREDTARLEPIIAELQRVLSEVGKREEALDKLGEKPEEAQTASSDPTHAASAHPAEAAPSSPSHPGEPGEHKPNT
jgi:chromosome segregation ATPase